MCHVEVAPPAPRYEVVPAHREGHVRVPGYWDWHDGRWYLERGRWHREHYAEYRGGRGYGDRDGDGVPNRFDAWPNNPYRH